MNEKRAKALRKHINAMDLKPEQVLQSRQGQKAHAPGTWRRVYQDSKHGKIFHFNSHIAY